MRAEARWGAAGARGEQLCSGAQAASARLGFIRAPQRAVVHAGLVQSKALVVARWYGACASLPKPIAVGPKHSF